MKMRIQKWPFYATALLTLSTQAFAGGGDDNPAAADSSSSSQELPQVIIVGNAPLPGVGLPLNEVAGTVQTFNAADLKRQQSLDITDYLNSNLNGINISESQDNPFQADINYHGFTASPLLGTPVGLSVYVDGVRVNEAFGDTVNWDLIPEAAIGGVTLASANPVYGLNTLGGAIAVQTKNGRDFPGTELQAYAGSFGRHAFEGATGGSSGNWDYFAAANFFKEDSWRDLSPSTVRQAFAKAGYHDDNNNLHLSYTYADNALIGNGTTPQSMLDYRYQSIYSAPDFTDNHLNFLNLTGSHNFDKDLVLSGNIYYRDLLTRSNNGDVNDDNYMSDDYDGPDIDCGAPQTSLTEVTYCANGINRASTLQQHTIGAGLQLTDTHDLAGKKNQLVVGASYDHATDSYTQQFQYATLTAARATVSIMNAANPNEVVNDVAGGSKTFGVYLTDTFSPTDQWHITASARYNHIEESINGYSVDTDVGDDAFNEAAPVTGDHTYSRVNPFIGATFTPNAELTLYANYNEGSRAPTVIELGCSNPAEPCGLPNDFASDPNLNQVITRTFEIGARGGLPSDWFRWSVDVFRSTNSNDIQFVATTTSEGYFDNVGTTRRQGLDLMFDGTVPAVEGLRWHLVYSYVEATYESSFLVNAESNSTADDDGNTMVSPGNRIPLIPLHTGRLRVDYALGKRLDVGATLIAASGIFLHGDENNANTPDGDEFIGSGHIPGYAVVNLDATWHVTRALDLFARVDNVFDKHYGTAGFLTSNSFNPDGSFRSDPDDWTNENAISPGMPIAVFAGVRLHIGD